MEDQSHRRADPEPTAAVTTYTETPPAAQADAPQTKPQSPTAARRPANSDEEA